MNIKNVLKALAISTAILGVVKADSMSFGFAQISSNGNQAIASQLGVTVSAASASATTVDFTFTNNVGIASNVTEIYFDALNLGTASLTQSGTVFSLAYALNPGNLPGGNSISPAFATSFGVDSDNGNGKGINNASDWVKISFLLNTNFYSDYAAVIAAITQPYDDNSIRFGLHVRSIGTVGGSEAFVNTPPRNPPSVPDSGTSAILLGLGLVSLALFRRKTA